MARCYSQCPSAGSQHPGSQTHYCLSQSMPCGTTHGLSSRCHSQPVNSHQGPPPQHIGPPPPHIVQPVTVSGPQSASPQSAYHRHMHSVGNHQTVTSHMAGTPPPLSFNQQTCLSMETQLPPFGPTHSAVQAAGQCGSAGRDRTDSRHARNHVPAIGCHGTADGKPPLSGKLSTSSSMRACRLLFCVSVWQCFSLSASLRACRLCFMYQCGSVSHCQRHYVPVACVLCTSVAVFLTVSVTTCLSLVVFCMSMWQCFSLSASLCACRLLCLVYQCGSVSHCQCHYVPVVCVLCTSVAVFLTVSVTTCLSLVFYVPVWQCFSLSASLRACRLLFFVCPCGSVSHYQRHYVPVACCVLYIYVAVFLTMCLSLVVFCISIWQCFSLCACCLCFVCPCGCASNCLPSKNLVLWNN